MTLERSCGAVVFTREGEEILYAIVEESNGYHGFPKGHMEGDETEKQTALREIWEETGLTVSFVDGFQTGDEYPLIREGRPDAYKKVMYFLAEYSGQTPCPRDQEVKAVLLLPYEKALETLELFSRKNILTEANRFLTQ